MIKKNFFWVKRVMGRLNNFFTLSRSNPTISEAKNSMEIIKGKITSRSGTSPNSLVFSVYEKYFNFLAQLGLRADWEITTTKDNLRLSGTTLQPLLVSPNNKKIIIFCHGVTNNRWSLFYCMYLALQLGYQVVTYDARNHGLSEKSYTSLGQVETNDLNDVVEFVQQKYQPEKIGLYGFSMGAATCLFWMSSFAIKKNSRVSVIICEAPFDNFSEQWKFAMGKGMGYYWKEYLATKLIYGVLNTSHEDLTKINPLLSLPTSLPSKLLLLHGLEDSVINWKASFNIWKKLQKNKLNQKKVSLYLCRYADHGEVPYIGDYLPQSLLWKNGKKVSRFSFSALFATYLQKNF